MTAITAKLNYLRISPRKVRLVADLIKGLDINQAKAQLRFLTKKTALPINKLLDSAIINASSNFNLDKNNLYISKILVNQGPSLKRWRPRAFGRATPVLKRTSHITLVLEERVPSKKIKKRKIREKIKKEQKEELVKEKTEKEKKITTKTKPVPPPRPYGATSVSKKRFFSRQTFGNIKKMFRRKSI